MYKTLSAHFQNEANQQRTLERMNETHTNISVQQPSPKHLYLIQSITAPHREHMLSYLPNPRSLIVLNSSKLGGTSAKVTFVCPVCDTEGLAGSPCSGCGIGI